jgi:DNA/RNA endonuclease YhcR with UshA esterase domain
MSPSTFNFALSTHEMRLLKALTVVLALSSVIAFLFASRLNARPLTAISAVSPSMNYAYVRIEGAITSYPTHSEKDGYLSFVVQDKSGEMRVLSYRASTTMLAQENRIPMPGDFVRVEGHLRVRDEDSSLILSAPESLSLERSDPAQIELSALDAMRIGERVRVVGQVRRVRSIGDSLQIVTLRAGETTLDMTVPTKLRAFGIARAFNIGDWLDITAGVGEFRGMKQLLPTNADAIQPAAQPPSFKRAVASLNMDLLGRWVEIQGRVSDLRPFSQGMRLEVTDESNRSIEVVLFDSIWERLPFSTTLTVDNIVQLQGRLIVFRETLEIQPELSVDVVLLK